MIISIGIILIIILSVVLALRSVDHELSVPKEVSEIKIDKNKKISGVILFLKKKIIHYTSKSS